MPIEIGWAFANPDTGTIQVEAHLIRPGDDWPIGEKWDETAAQLHGISLPELHAEGRSPEDILRRMNEGLGGRELYSDAPAWDDNWLRMIVAAAGAKLNFSVSQMEAHTLIGIVARAQGWEPEPCLAVMDEISRDYPRTHRAAADAHHLAALWLAMRQGPNSGKQRPEHVRI